MTTASEPNFEPVKVCAPGECPSCDATQRAFAAHAESIEAVRKRAEVAEHERDEARRERDTVCAKHDRMEAERDDLAETLRRVRAYLEEYAGNHSIARDALGKLGAT